MNIPFKLALVGALCSFPAIAQACSCMAPPAPKIALEKSAAVFVGRVASVEKSQFSNKFQFSVSKQWKGIEGKTVSIVTATNSAACGINFDEDRDYLVYAFKTEGDDQLRTNLCTRTARAADAATDLAELGAPITTASVGYTENLAYGNEMQLNAPEIQRLGQTLQANPKSRMFRLSWPVKGTDAVTAIYDRSNSTLKFYSKLHGATQTTVKSANYSGVTDEVLARWASSDYSPSQLGQITKYGATEEVSKKRTFAR